VNHHLILIELANGQSTTSFLPSIALAGCTCIAVDRASSPYVMVTASLLQGKTIQIPKKWPDFFKIGDET
jgi:hypothetical protein